MYVPDEYNQIIYYSIYCIYMIIYLQNFVALKV
jgi:hypothetical protein